MDRRAFVVAAASLASLTVAAPSAFAAAEKSVYEGLIKDAIQAAVSKKIADPDALASKMEQAARIGIEFCKAAAAAEPANKAIIEFVIANFDKIKNTPLEKFEDEWMEGASYKAAGHDYSKLDQAGRAASAVDSIVHPLSARLAFLAWKNDKKDEHLKMIVTELEEMMGHMKYL
jgi:hypothetical protein